MADQCVTGHTMKRQNYLVTSSPKTHKDLQVQHVCGRVKHQEEQCQCAPRGFQLGNMYDPTFITKTTHRRGLLKTKLKSQHASRRVLTKVHAQPLNSKRSPQRKPRSKHIATPNLQPKQAVVQKPIIIPLTAEIKRFSTAERLEETEERQSEERVKFSHEISVHERSNFLHLGNSKMIDADHLEAKSVRRLTRILFNEALTRHYIPESYETTVTLILCVLKNVLPKLFTTGYELPRSFAQFISALTGSNDIDRSSFWTFLTLLLRDGVILCEFILHILHMNGLSTQNKAFFKEAVFNPSSSSPTKTLVLKGSTYFPKSSGSRVKNIKACFQAIRSILTLNTRTSFECELVLIEANVEPRSAVLCPLLSSEQKQDDEKQEQQLDRNIATIFSLFKELLNKYRIRNATVTRKQGLSRKQETQSFVSIQAQPSLQPHLDLTNFVYQDHVTDSAEGLPKEVNLLATDYTIDEPQTESEPVAVNYLDVYQ